MAVFRFDSRILSAILSTQIKREFGMSRITNTLLAATLALGAATSAQAITFSDNVNNAFTFTFSWDDKSANSFDEFHTTTFAFDFDLSIEGVTGQNPAIGYTVLQGGTFLGDTTFPFSVSTCATGAGTSSECNLMFDDEATPKTLFSGLSAGEYTFGVFAGTNTQAGSITFGVSKVAAVPLPAAGLLLLGALGGTAALRRRRKA